MTKPRVLVTGGGVRVGRAISLSLAKAGYALAVHYRSRAQEAEAFAQEVNAQYGAGTAVTIACDLSLTNDVAQMIPRLVAAHGPLAGLVNSASVFEDDRLETLTRAGWDLHLDTNLWAPVVLIQAFAKQLPQGLEGSVVNLLDQGVLKLNPQFLSYTVSKTALWTLTRTLAQALAPHIRVNGVGPGPTLASIHQSAEGFAAQARATLLQRPSPPEDIAAAVVYLMQARSVTGHMIPVDCGQHLAWETPDVVLTKG
ncbi:MAG TPA: short chain dehydrogenase [Alphaproteobacteria bacterium]|nr:short chain dehydrogenase [Alphaproteobacteria bacterium]HAJ46226.1 short chain dehydrogenase [Alphaproteobacteria bacterium]